MWHPLAAIPVGRRRRAFVPLLALTLLLMATLGGIDQPIRTAAAPNGIVSFELAGDTATAQRMIDSWDARARQFAAITSLVGAGLFGFMGADTTGGGSGEVIYLSPATGYVTIYRKRVDGGRSRTIVTAGRSADLESFHPFDSRMDASRPGYLLFAARYGDRDGSAAISDTLFQVHNRRAAEEY